MEYFNFPNEWKLDRNIPKESIYKASDADEKLKKIFVENVDKIRISYILTRENTNIPNFIEADESYTEINFIKITLRKDNKERVITELLHKLIPKSTIIILEYEGKNLISSTKKRIIRDRVVIDEIYNSLWLDLENEYLKEFNYKKFSFENLKTFYESIIENIRTLNLGEKLKIEPKMEKEKISKLETLNKQIDYLKNLRDKETQTNKVVKIQSELMEKLRERVRLLER